MFDINDLYLNVTVHINCQLVSLDWLFKFV